MTDLKSLLNPEQFEAATAPDGPLLILAAAGTGKTRTLVYRVVHLLEHGFYADQILLLTFTNHASKEMLERATAVTKGLASGLWGGTFHSIANRILRRHATLLGYPNNFTILDEDDQLRIVKKEMKDMGIVAKEFLKPKHTLSILSETVNKERDLEDVIAEKSATLSVSPATLKELILRYVEHKKKLQAMDFDDLLVNVVKLFRENPLVLQHYQNKFRHVLVDEFQDTNSLQSEFTDMLVASHRNISVVGDDSQSIYSWRGANFNNILNFPQKYPDARVIKLERNYRSLPEILTLANESIKINTVQFPKTLRPTRDSLRTSPTLYSVPLTHDQGRVAAALVADAIRSGVKPKDIAILYRAHFNAKEVQMQLTQEKLPFCIRSGIGFFEQAHIKDFLALLRIWENPADSISFLRFIELLPGVGALSAEKIWKKLDGHFELENALLRERLEGLLPARAKPGWHEFSLAFDRVGRDSFPRTLEPTLKAFLGAFYRSVLQKLENPEDREEDLMQLCAQISQSKNLSAFLEEVALLTNTDRNDAAAKAEDASDRITLSTIHQAKGEEWPYVILLSVSQGMFPSTKLLDSGDHTAFEEERRLFYVAVTRAKDTLVMISPRSNYSPDGGIYPCELSQFLKEVPRSCFITEELGAWQLPGESRSFNPDFYSGGGYGGGYGGSYGSRRKITATRTNILDSMFPTDFDSPPSNEPPPMSPAGDKDPWVY